MNFIKVLFSTSILIASLIFTSMLQAQEYENIGNISFGGVAFFADSARNVDDNVGLFIGGEMPLANRWSIAADLYTVDSEIQGNGADVDLDFGRIGVNYYLNQLNGWQPFIGVGFGNLEIESSGTTNDFDEDTFDIGFGMKRMLNDNWMLRGDYKVINGNKTHGWDDAISVGVSYAFGRRSSTVASRPVAQAASTTVTDRDNDGVPDAMDACRNTPAGAVVDSRGCEIDSDRDGVVNSRDNCPDTSINLSVDANGCPILDISQRRVELVVNFAYDSSVVTQEYNAEITEFADFMKEYANTNAVIEGHTDNRGSDAYNQPLSEQRANAVRNELVTRHNIPADRVTAVGYGESRPISNANTEAGHAMNRRIEAVLSVDVEEQRRR